MDEEVKEIVLALPMRAYKLLVKAAKEAKLSEDEMARVAVYSVLANYADEIMERASESDPAHDGADNDVKSVDDGGK